jgi:hypothetical protein
MLQAKNELTPIFHRFFTQACGQRTEHGDCVAVSAASNRCHNCSSNESLAMRKAPGKQVTFSHHQLRACHLTLNFARTLSQFIVEVNFHR